MLSFKGFQSPIKLIEFRIRYFRRIKRVIKMIVAIYSIPEGLHLVFYARHKSGSNVQRSGER